MAFIRAARAIGGLLSIAMLLVMVFLDFWVQSVTLQRATIILMLTIISGLLGIDLITEHLPVKLTIERPGDDEGGK